MSNSFEGGLAGQEQRLIPQQRALSEICVRKRAYIRNSPAAIAETIPRT